MQVELLSVTPNAEKVIEQAGRTAYQSFDKQKEGSEKEFIKMLIKKGHLSVLEHAYATFRIKGVSRALTHQLIRHRLCSFTQKSQRWVSESGFNYITPDSVKTNERAKEVYDFFMALVKDTYNALIDLGIPKEDARFVLPNATETEIVVTANLREWRHIILLRGSKSAQWEIRRLAIKILEILKQYVPTVFVDFKINKEKEIVEKIELV